MAIADRLRGLAGRAGAAIQSFSRQVEPVKGIGQVANIAGSGGYRNNEKAEKIASSRDALYGSVTRLAGPILTRYSTYPGTALTPTKLRAIFEQADLGIMLQKADLDEQVYMRDAHLRCVDASIRNAVAGKPFRVRPANDTDLGIALAKFMRAVVDQIDSFDRSMYTALTAHGNGYSCEEIIWENATVRLSNERGVVEGVPGLFPRCLEWVHNKHFRFNLVTDEPVLDVGTGGAISLVDHKFLFHVSPDATVISKRGYMRSAHPLLMLKSHAIRDYAVFVAMYGIPNVYGQYDRAVYEQEEAKALYGTILQDFGQGKPALLPDDLKINITQPPTGGRASDPQATLIGWVNTEVSKLVQNETLTTELGGVGAYNASETHADVKHDTAVMLGKGLSSTVRSDLFASVIELNAPMLQRRFKVTLDELHANTPLCGWRIEREVNPEVRMRIFASAVNDGGMDVEADQVRDELGIDPPRKGAELLRGKAIPIAADGAAVGSAAAAAGVKNPKPDEAPPR